MTPEAVNLFGITILEPITLITDTILAIICIVLFVKITKLNKKNYLSRNWRGFFIWFGISTFLAGLGHGLMDYTGKWLLIAAWIISGLVPYFNEAAAVMRVAKKPLRRGLMYFILFELLAVSLLVLFTQKFIFVTINSVFAVAGIVLFIRGRDFILTKNEHSKFIILAIFVGFLSAVTHTLKLSVSEWFNHKDVSHVILMASLLLFYKGAKGEILANEQVLTPGELKEEAVKIKL